MERKASLKSLFEFTHESFSEVYEVLRTVGFTVKAKKGSGRCRIEVIKRDGDRLYSAIVWIVDREGRWSRWSQGDQPTLRRKTPDFALKSMIGYVQQYMAD